MKSLVFCGILLGAMAGGLVAQEKVEAYGKIFRHNDGTRTETQKMGNSNEIREETFDKNNVLTAVRVFQVNAKGQLLHGDL